MLMFVPADLPLMPDIDFSMLASQDYGGWEMFKLTKSAKKDKDKYKVQEFFEDFEYKNPNFLEWIKLLPHKGMINVKIHRQDKINGAPLHVDLMYPQRDILHYHHLQVNEPCGYRVIMDGNPNDTTYALNPKGDKVYLNMPKNSKTNTYIQNFTTCIHGVEEEIHRDILFFHFMIDPKRHEELIRKSLKRYREYAIFFNMDTKYV